MYTAPSLKTAGVYSSVAYSESKLSFKNGDSIVLIIREENSSSDIYLSSVRDAAVFSALIVSG